MMRLFQVAFAKRKECPNAPKIQFDRFRQFRKESDGSVLIFSLFLLVMMLMIAGMAVDLIRAETQRSRLQSTLDRAILAAASLEQTLHSEAVVLDYFDKAGLGAYITAEDITVVETATSKSVRATAKSDVQTFFMNLVGVESLATLATGKAEESISDIEISLVLDVSGSMGSYSASGQKKIDDLIDAAQEFVYLMQCDPDAEKPYDHVCVVEEDTISINLIPYAEQVLVGEELLQQFNVTEEHDFSSCVDFDQSDYLSTAIPELASLNPMAATIQRAGPLDRRSNHSGGHGSSSRFARDLGTSSTNARTCRTHTYREIVPFSNSYTDLTAKIGTLKAQGYTSIHVGMKWASALLDPAFQPALTNLTTGVSPLIDPAFDGRPFSYSRPLTKKVIVLMTDGKNTSLYSLKDAYRDGPSPFWLNKADGIPEDDELSVYRASSDDYYRVKKDYNRYGQWSNYYHLTPYGDADAVQLSYPEMWQTFNADYYDDEFSWLPNAWDVENSSYMNARLKDICDAAALKGVEVFTMGFETSTSSSATIASCATKPSNHFDVDGTDISEAFNSIAREIHELRLTN